MNDHLRELLYIPLGVIPSIFFVLRMLIQWIRSEKLQQSTVTPLFWKLSLAGNLFLLSHYIVQVQFHFALFQCCNALIAWRNLNLIGKKGVLSTRQTLLIATLSIIGLTLLFILQSKLFIGHLDWIRTPKKPFDDARTYHTLAWHIFGTIGGVIFSSRFWIQWWLAEKYQCSDLGRSFWILSIIGSTILVIYFTHMRDFISLFYNCFALIPYLRNLALLKKVIR